MTIAVFRGGAPHFSSLVQLTCVVFPLNFGGPSKNKVHTLSHMQPMVLEYESQHLPLSKTTQSDVGFYIPAPWVADGILYVLCSWMVHQSWKDNSTQTFQSTQRPEILLSVALDGGVRSVKCILNIVWLLF